MTFADLIAFLKEWKELVGAAIGAFASIVVALLVAHDARRREDVSAAMVLVGNLTSLIAAANTLEKKAAEENISISDYPMWLAYRLAFYRPPMSPLFEGCVARLMPVDVRLAAHLEIFGVAYRSVEHHLERLSRDTEHCREHNKPARSEADVRADAEVIQKNIAMAANHANCAERLLTCLVLSHWRTWHRLRRLVCPTKEERECKCLLSTGNR
jgi:hypothetical protein